MESFKVGNIKSFVDSGEIEIKPLTILIGKNSCGKSSLIRFPIVLKQTVQENISPLLFYGKLIDYGNYEDVIFNHEESNDVNFQLNFETRQLKQALFLFVGPRSYRESDFLDYLKKYEKVSVNLNIGRKMHNEKFWGDLEVKDFSLEVGDQEIFRCYKTEQKKYKIKLLDKDYSEDVEVQFSGFFPIIEINRRINSNNVDEIGENNLLLIRGISIAIEKLVMTSMEEVSYIGPFRRTPERNYRFQEANLLSIGADGEYTSELLASYYRKNDVEFFKKLNDWLQQHLNIHINVEELKGGIYRVLVKDLKSGIINNIRDVGFGLSQVLPIVVQVLIQKDNEGRNIRAKNRLQRVLKRINIFEQPELHLHPAAQSSLADLFILGHELDSRNHFFIETHSEHLILRLRRRILEGRINPDHVAIYFVQKSENSSGYSCVEKLNLNENGDIENWPEDFFDQDFQEIIEINKLRSKGIEGEFEW
ncbi:DUF3696 domain-containing protein [Bacillus thuringiensis]|uniref:DUF3696 domain-containing protein n=1 Tax=Bacillus thuringiensis TaxID=1428 RepID=UPI003DA14EBA